MPSIQGQGNWYAFAPAGGNTQNAYANSFGSQLSGGNYASVSNFLSYPYSVATVQWFTQTFGRALGIRADYSLAALGDGFPSAPWSFPQVAPKVKNQIWDFKSMDVIGYVKGHPY